MRDMDGNEFIKYKDLLENCKHKKTAMTDLKELNKLVIKVQAAWKGYMQRKAYLKIKLPDLQKIGQQFARTGKVMFRDEEQQKASSNKNAATAKKLTPLQKKEEAEKKKK